MKRFSRRRLLSVIIATPGILAADAACVEPTSLRTTHLRVGANPRHRFVHLTDIHYKGDRSFLQHVVERINSISPEFVCFTGDLIEDAAYAPEALELLSQIKSPLYGIPGNHDFWADLDFDLPRETFRKTGGSWLMDQSVTICDGRLQICGMSGVDFKPFEGCAGAKRILLSHYPAAVDKFIDTKFDLILAGHSHGGQIRFPGYGALVVPFGVGDYQLGYYDTQAGPLYVNAGIGYFYANVRLFCRPEITVIEI